jgi:hypothetical protein
MDEIKGQPQVEWWAKDHPSQAPSIGQRKWRCDSVNNPENPFHTFVGNAHAVRRLNRAAFAALGRYNHECSDSSFSLIGPPSTGKATLAKMFADLLGLPFATISAQNCQSMTDLSIQIAEVCEKFVCGDGVTLELREMVGDVYMIPPIIVFVNEFHALPKKVEQGLAKAINGKFTTENGFSFNTSHVCWIISTTDADLLVDPFDKFTSIHFKPLTAKEEVAQVVAIHNPDWTPDVCQLVAQHAGSPREALAVATEMRLEFEMNAGNWMEVAEIVARDRDDQKSTPWVNRLRISRN